MVQPNTSDTGRRVGPQPMPAGTVSAQAPAARPQLTARDYSWIQAATAPKPPPDPMQQYIDSFNSSLDQQRSSLDAALAQSLGALGQRRDAAANVVAQIPGQVQQNYQQVQTNFDNAQGLGAAALAPDTQKMLAGFDTPFDTAFAADKATGLNARPALDLGVLASSQAGEAGLRQQALMGQQDINQQRAQFAQQMLLHQMDVQEHEKDRAAAREDAATQRAAEKDDWKAKADYENKLQTDSQETKDAALAPLGLTKGQVNAVKSDPRYARFSDAINNGTLDRDMIRNQLTRTDPTLLGVLEAENPSFFGSDRGKGTNKAFDKPSYSWYNAPENDILGAGRSGDFWGYDWRNR